MSDAPFHELTLTDRAVVTLDVWRTEAIAAVVSGDVDPLTSFSTCLLTLIRMGGRGYAESDSLIVVDTTSGLTIGMHRDRKGVCSLNS